ncbi:MAG: GNAT family N-acetyltransferase [Nitrospira sp.]|nr:GNAT family N-acetyltransferase [Nitrospira sp.]
MMVNIRPATENDFGALLQVQQAAFGAYASIFPVSSWIMETLNELQEDAKTKHIIVAELEGAIVGSVRFWIVGGVCIIRLLSVHPHYQGKGIGKELIREVERRAVEAHKLYACTMLRIPRNILFFLGLGYKAESLLPDHYDHLDLICFAKYRTDRLASTYEKVS